MSDHTDDTGTASAAVLDRTRAEDWARFTPPTSDVRQRATALRRRRNIGTPVGVVGLATVLAGGVVTLTGGTGTSGDSGTSPGAAAQVTVTATGTGTAAIPQPDDQAFHKVIDGAVLVGSGAVGNHIWSVKIAVFASADALRKVWPNTGPYLLPDNLPASGPVFVRVYFERDRFASIGVMGLPGQLPAIPEGKPSVVDPWYAANLGVATSVVDSHVDHLAVTSGGATTNYHTVDVKGFRFVTFPATGPGDVTKIVAYDRFGTALAEKSGHFLPYGVFPYQLPSTDPRAAKGTWG